MRPCHLVPRTGGGKVEVGPDLTVLLAEPLEEQPERDAVRPVELGELLGALGPVLPPRHGGPERGLRGVAAGRDVQAHLVEECVALRPGTGPLPAMPDHSERKPAG